MKLAILGATGGLGSLLAKFFHGQSYAVLAYGRNSDKLAKLYSDGIQTVQGDLNDPMLQSAIKAFKPDLIINAAGKSGFSRGRAAYINANVETAKSALALARSANNCRLIHFSSPSVTYLAKDCRGIGEDQPFSPPVSAYAWSRQQAEQVLSAACDLPIIIVRLRSAYGYGIASPLETIRQRIKNRQIVPLVRRGAAAIDLVHVDDLTSAIGAIIKMPAKPGPLVVNLAGPRPISLQKMVDGLAAYENVKAICLPLPGFIAAIAGQVAEMAMLALNENREPAMCNHIAGSLQYSQTLNLEKFIRETGWAPQISFEDALRNRLL